MDTQDNTKKKVPYFPSKRWDYAIVGCLGNVFVYAFRINLSVAIVCMVREPMPNVTNATAVPNPDGCPQLERQRNVTAQGEFEWSRELRGFILSSFFFGYILTQIPGGMLSQRFGGKHVHGTALFVTALANLFLPVATRAHVGLLIALRVLMGLCTGVCFPALNNLWGRWAPPLERARLQVVCYSGTMIGNIVTLSTSGFLCATGVDGGWPLIFYVFGGSCLVWYISWLFLVYNSPATHPRISLEERKYIIDGIGLTEEAKGKTLPIPWFRMLTSLPVISIFVSHVCTNIGNYTLLTSLPTYMRDVLMFDIRANGVLSALPYIAMFIASIGGSILGDLLRKRGILSTTNSLKVFQGAGFLVPACLLVALGFVTCHAPGLAVALLTLAVGFTSGSRFGINVNPVDIAPRFAGVIYSVSNTLGTIPGIVSPIAVGALTTNGTRLEWQRVFYIMAGCYAFGAVFYFIFASGLPQPWAHTPEEMEGFKLRAKSTEKYSSERQDAEIMDSQAINVQEDKSTVSLIANVDNYMVYLLHLVRLIQKSIIKPKCLSNPSIPVINIINPI